MMDFTAKTAESLHAMLDSMKGNDVLADIAADVQAELDRRAAEEVKRAETEASRTLADEGAMHLSNIAHSKVAEISNHDGPAYKGAVRSLVGLIAAAYDMTELKARHAVTVLTDKKRPTDVKSDTDVAGAVAYAKAYKKSTAFNQS